MEKILVSDNLVSCILFSEMETGVRFMSSNNGHPLTKMVKRTVPQLTSTTHKGQSGRIAVIGGSLG